MNSLYVHHSSNLDVAEVDGVHKGQTSLGDGQLSLVLVSGVGVDLGFLGIGLVLEVELGVVGLAVGLTLVSEFGDLVELLFKIMV